LSETKLRVLFFIIGLLLFLNMSWIGLWGFLGLFFMHGSLFPEPINSYESDNSDSDYAKNRKYEQKIRELESEQRLLLDLASQERFKKQNEYWKNKYEQDNPKFKKFEVHYMTYNYANVIKEIVDGANISEVQRKYQADPKVKRLITVRDFR